MYGFSFPKFDFFILGFFFLIPVLFVLEKNPRYSAFKILFLFSFPANLVILYWIPNVMIEYGQMNFFIGIFGLIILSMFISFFYALAGIFIRKSFTYGNISLLLIPSIWISKDLMLDKIFGGFPWCFTGYSQYRNIFFIQTSELGGVYLITFLIILINILIYRFIIKREKKILFVLIFIIFLNYSTGFFLYLKNHRDESAIEIQHAGIIQPNTGQDFSYKKKWRKVTLQELFIESEKLKEKGAEFIVWPEFTVSIYPLQNRSQLNSILKFSDSVIPVFAGFTDFKNSEEIYNSMILFDRNKRIAKYDKTHLVPYGEYILFKDLLFFIKKITNEISEFTPGEKIHNISFNNHLVSTPICYELIYPELVREFIYKGGELILIISNDSWYGTSSAPFQLLAMTVFRAIETRRYILRSTSNGISSLIDSSGKIRIEIPLNIKSSFITPFKYLKTKSFYVKFGYLFPYSALIFIFTFFLIKKFFYHKIN